MKKLLILGLTVLLIGALAVAKTSDAAENGPVAGVFTVSRADSHGDLADAERGTVQLGSSAEECRYSCDHPRRQTA